MSETDCKPWGNSAGSTLFLTMLSRLKAQDTENARLRDLLHEADRMLAEALPKLQEAERYLRAAREA